MNKAFVREPEDNGERSCPVCGSLGVPVGRETVAAHLAPDVVNGLGDAAFYCPFPRCGVAYFDLYERSVDVAAMLDSAYPKDPLAPLCRCFGLTTDDVEADVREGGVRRVRALVARSKTDEARCQLASPDGRCCVPEVQRYYMKVRSQPE
jgi:hypothetical protein